jgi:dihydroorotase
MLIIKGGRIIDPANHIDKKGHLLIERGKIEAVLPEDASLSAYENADIFDAAGLCVVPGLVDIQVHLREPGQEYKEDLLTGSQAAVAGGVTSMVCMANTKPVNDHAAITRHIIGRAKQIGLCNVYPVSTISKGMAGKELADIGEQKEAGCVGITDDGKTVADTGLLKRAMDYAAGLDIIVMEHCEEPSLSQGHMHYGKWSLMAGIVGKPHASEDIIVARDIELAALTGARLHIQHVSSKRSVEMIREGKARGVKVTGEATPHHLWLTDEDVYKSNYDTNFKMNPPLRTAEDREALRQALADGTLDNIATDHAPHAIHEKAVEFDIAAPGLVGLEQLLGLSLKLVKDKVLTMRRMVELLTIGPSKLVGLPTGTLSVGAEADVCIFDPSAKVIVEPAKLKSKSKNTPFGGWELPGKVIRTYHRGKLVFEG